MNKIGLIGAMEEEIDILKHFISNVEIINRADMVFYKGILNGLDTVLVRSGIGKVNAAIAAQILISEFNVDYIINTGVAGGIKSGINVGDIVISSDAIEHDFDTTAFGDELGVIPRMKTSVFKADKYLIDIALKAANDNIDGKAYVGRIVSGDRFVSSKEEARRLGQQFNAYAVEMEGAAIAHTAYLNNIPFVIIRSISDNADGNATSDFNLFVKKASIVSSNLVKEMINMIKEI
ncbi:MTA/SAH nucleosidase [Thermoanaerobacterium thermosaccharolyticum DSM 571]|uniref:adenosylhomocysteine nucleosidase n=1 Tax=Thermoanaerobacterium thermosaccharolyticum (strain ATCC 7956 / DSM 571 / NCIMB 9385 / NCA 3814 / NCTC 13789 / WDCM 00135 / 2032) TaxID=580327 RepID=D9TPQ9_THETC|nr:5'-methylthioadenosine/adenosylhomocysteine nucleosidase [Thermoanaerobacterium thermosaccharolyticum]ADL68741.1 MTA/SAH nucleosidase [Thermoanaerobacterium thermosaccharolyticum DSM 571]